MKVVLVSPYFPPHVGGAENYAYNIAKGLRVRKVDIVIVTSNHTKENKYTEETISGMKVYRLPVWFTLSKSPFNPLWFFYLVHIFQKEKPDIINAHTPVPFIADFANLAAQWCKKPFILTYHNDLVKEESSLTILLNTYYFILGRFLLASAKKIVVTSRYYISQSPYLKPFSHKAIVIPPGIDEDIFAGKEKISNVLHNVIDKKIVLFVGTMDYWHSHKGLHYLLDAMEEVVKKDKNVVLFAVGKGNHIPFYKKYTSQKKLTSNVFFTGFVPEDELIGYYKNATVITLPSTNNSEGFGMTLLEAGLYSKPVIATMVGGIPAVVQDLQSGILVEPKNSTHLANAILKLTSDGALAKKLGENGKKVVTAKYLWKHQVLKTVALYNTL